MKSDKNKMHTWHKGVIQEKKADENAVDHGKSHKKPIECILHIIT